MTPSVGIFLGRLLKSRACLRFSEHLHFTGIITLVNQFSRPQDIFSKILLRPLVEFCNWVLDEVAYCNNIPRCIQTRPTSLPRCFQISVADLSILLSVCPKNFRKARCPNTVLFRSCFAICQAVREILENRPMCIELPGRCEIINRSEFLREDQSLVLYLVLLDLSGRYASKAPGSRSQSGKKYGKIKCQ